MAEKRKINLDNIYLLRINGEVDTDLDEEPLKEAIVNLGSSIEQCLNDELFDSKITTVSPVVNDCFSKKTADYKKILELVHSNLHELKNQIQTDPAENISSAPSELLETFMSNIETLLSYNPEPVKYGHWIDDKDFHNIQICSECGEEHSWDEYRALYCDVCGAKMY